MPYETWLLKQKNADYCEASQFRDGRAFVRGAGQRKCYLRVDPLDDDLMGSENGAENLSVSSMSSSSTRTTLYNQIQSCGYGSPANPDFIARRFSTSHEAMTDQTHDFFQEAESVVQSDSHQSPHLQQSFRAGVPKACMIQVDQYHDNELPFEENFSNGKRLSYDPRSSPRGSIYKMLPSERPMLPGADLAPPSPTGALNSPASYIRAERRPTLPEPDPAPPSPPGASDSSASYLRAEHSWHDSMVLAVALLEGIKMVDMGELRRRRRNRGRDRRTGKGAPEPHGPHR
jgi:hypothetical protein